MNIVKQLFLGKYKSEHELKPAIKNQAKNVKRVWKNIKTKDFGLERLLRLFLVTVQFLFPGLYIRHISGLYSLITRKIAVEIYVILKLTLPLLFFWFDLTHLPWIAIINTYFLVETVLYLSNLIFLSDIYAQPISYKRSILLLFINYVEIVLEFAILYSYFNLNNGIFPDQILKDIDIIYFSFVSFSPIGFAEINSIIDMGKVLVISQIFVFLIFGGLFLSVFASNIGQLTYFNSHKEKKWKKNK